MAKVAKRATEGHRAGAHPRRDDEASLLLEIQMANTFITPTMLTRGFCASSTRNSTSLASVNRDYDGAFAKKGAKIGTSLNIRLPTSSRFVPALPGTQDITGVTPPRSTQKGVDFTFSSVELTMRV